MGTLAARRWGAEACMAVRGRFAEVTSVALPLVAVAVEGTEGGGIVG